MNETNPEPQILPARVVRWTQKLLDLSLRNRMLNVRDVKQVLPLVCRDIARLEDQLASDETVSIACGDPTENFLVSGCTPDETKRRLTTLFRTAKSDLEESGVNTLFLAIGFLRWKVSPTDEKQYRAPLLLMHGVRDGVVPYQQSEMLWKRMEAICPGRAELRLYPERNHSDSGFMTRESCREITDFFDRILDRKS